MIRSVLWILTLVAALTAAMWQFGSLAPQPEIAGYAWRRTTSGWEHIPQWHSPEPSEEPTLHPLLIASLQLATSLLALSAVPTSAGPSVEEVTSRTLSLAGPISS